jgi:hypothetical protein
MHFTDCTTTLALLRPDELPGLDRPLHSGMCARLVHAALRFGSGASLTSRRTSSLTLE